MTLKFTLNESVASDPKLGIDIYSPRVEPVGNTSEREYQYRLAEAFLKRK